MISEYPERTATRLSKEHKDEIEKLVEKGAYESFSDFTRTAIAELLNAIR